MKVWKNYLMFAALFLAGLSALQAQRYGTRDGHVRFFSATPVENIEADNHKAGAVLDLSTKKIQFGMLIKAFEFEKALMEEHFNENYMESSTHPKASFKGMIEKPADVDFTKPGTYDVVVTGKMTIHGVTKDFSTPGKLVVTEEQVSVDAKFMVSPEEYDIKIPNTVRDNIAKEIEVTVDMDLKKL